MSQREVVLCNPVRTAIGAYGGSRLLHSMRRDGVKRGVVALCIGGGQKIALALETI
jgi:acetyl-CoA C-acetyltransferase